MGRSKRGGCAGEGIVGNILGGVGEMGLCQVGFYGWWCTT